MWLFCRTAIDQLFIYSAMTMTPHPHLTVCLQLTLTHNHVLTFHTFSVDPAVHNGSDCYRSWCAAQTAWCVVYLIRNRLKSDLSWGSHHSLPSPTAKSGLSLEYEASLRHTFLRLFGASSLANSTILLLDLQLFVLVRQLIYNLRSCNYFPWGPQAHKNWLIVLCEQ